MPLRVLILAHDFPPLNAIGARRPFSWYSYFPENDIHPIVITKSWEGSSSSIHEIALQKGSREDIIEEHETRTLIRVPLSRTPSEKMLSRYGLSRFVAIRKMFSFLYLILAYPFSLFDKNVKIFRAAERYLQQHKVDFIIATGEPFILFKHAHLLSKKFRIPWIADFRDGWISNHVTAQQKGIMIQLLRSWEFIFEKKYLSSCKFITTVDPLLAEKLSKLHHKKAHVIYNGFEEFVPEKTNEKINGLPLLLCHAGTPYPGHHVEALLEAVRDLDSEKKISATDLQVQFLGVEFYPEQHQRLLQFSHNVIKYLQTTQRLPREQARQVQSAADFLILFSEKFHPVISSKVFEYISLRRPIVTMLNDHSLLSNLINDLNAGVVLESVDDVKNFLLEKIEMKKKHRQLFNLKLNEEKARFYLRETQAARLAALLK